MGQVELVRKVEVVKWRWSDKRKHGAERGSQEEEEVSDAPRSHGCALFLPPSLCGPPPLPLVQATPPGPQPADHDRGRHLLGARQPRVRCLRRPLPDGIAIPCFFLRVCWCACAWGMGGVRCARVNVKVLQGEVDEVEVMRWSGGGGEVEEVMRWRR